MLEINREGTRGDERTVFLASHYHATVGTMEPLEVISITFSDGRKYEGQALGGTTPHGKGVTTYTDPTDKRHRHTGSYAYGLPDGEGVLTYKDGAEYTGDFKKGKCEGRGEYTVGDRSWTHRGMYRNDLRSGPGTVSYRSGATFTGIYEDDKRNGQGTETTTNSYGNRFITEGIWRDGAIFDGTEAINGTVHKQFKGGKEINRCCAIL